LFKYDTLGQVSLKQNVNHNMTLHEWSLGDKTNLPNKGSSNDYSNRIGGVMVSVLASSAVDGGFEPVGSNQRL
jgi:hypothetical protein